MAVEESGLEMYCAEDGAWYDGSLSLASENRVRVHFTNFDSDEDEYWEPGTLEDPEKLLRRVRVSSEQLQDTQCRTVAKDTPVCGCYEDGDSRKYFDAKVVQVEHVPHPSDGDCTCKFKLRWASGPKRGRQSTVWCADVCLLSNQDPTEHSMIKALMAQSLLKPEELGKKAKVQKKEPKAHQIKALKKRKQVVPKDITAIQTLTEAEEAVPSAKKQPLRKKVGIDAVEDNDTSPEQVDDAIKSVLVDIQQNHTEDSGDHLHESTQEHELVLDALKSIPARKRARHAMMQSEALVTNPILPFSLQKGVDAISPEPGFASYDEAEASSKHGGRLSRSSLPCDQNTEAGDEGYRNLPLQQPLTQISQGNGVSAAYASSMLLICNMEVDCSALDVMEVLCSRTPGIIAVHILPSREFESSTCGYVLYKDGESAHNALGYLVSNEIIIASDNDRPWIISGATLPNPSKVFGIASHSAFKEEGTGFCGIFSNHPPSKSLHFLTPVPQLKEHYDRANKMKQLYLKHQTQRKKLFEKIKNEEKKILSS
ncbi:unnamed protein product [Sphagnum jensenii]|uniref:SAWADEE domain-containing protein n=1 Tax=Sphagnum jensenii TaxID=128206 RepID=A0ABP1C224_9BRYO